MIYLTFQYKNHYKMFGDLNPSIAVLILAAGGSTRMGKPKLAQKIGNESLFERALSQVEGVEALSKLVILGADRDLYQSSVPDNFELIVNDHWEDGLSSSIKAGITYINKFGSGIEYVLIVLADMPLVTETYLNALINAFSVSKKGIVVSNYGQSFGPPAIFSRKYFPELLKMKGDRGARGIFSKFKHDLYAVDFPDGLVDIDTPEDLLRFKKID